MYSFKRTDTEAPVVTVPNDVPGTNVEPGTPDAVVVWAPAPSAFDTFEGSVGAAAIQCQDQNGRAVTSASRFPVGLTTVTCTASDSSLNEGSNQFNITVIGRYINSGKTYIVCVRLASLC